MCTCVYVHMCLCVLIILSEATLLDLYPFLYPVHLRKREERREVNPSLCRGHWDELWQTEADSVTKNPDTATETLVISGQRRSSHHESGQMQAARQSPVFRGFANSASGTQQLHDLGQVSSSARGLTSPVSRTVVKLTSDHDEC